MNSIHNRVEANSTIRIATFAFICALLSLTALNYVAKLHVVLTPIHKNGIRLVIGAVILFIFGVAYGFRLWQRPMRPFIWRYAIVGPMNMALPQALIFLALDKRFGAEPVEVGMAESAIVVVILIYLTTQVRRFSIGTVVAVGVVFIGLAAFIGSSKAPLGSMLARPTEFATKLKKSEDQISVYIHSRLNPSTQEALDRWHGTVPMPQALRTLLEGDVHSLLSGPSIWSPQPFAQVSIHDDTRELLGRGSDNTDVSRLNAFLLHEAFPLEIDRPKSWLRWLLLLLSALFSGIGLILDDKFRWPDEERPPDRWNPPAWWPKNTIVSAFWYSAVSASIRKCLFNAMISSALTFAFVATSKTAFPGVSERLELPNAAADWGVLIMLALTGTCLSWFSIFLLIKLEQFDLLAAAIASIPVLSAAIDLILGRNLDYSSFQWAGAAIALAALGYLINQKLVEPVKRSNTAVGSPPI